MTDDESPQHDALQRFHDEVDKAIPDAYDQPYFLLHSVDDTHIVLDGSFTIEQLKAIVGAWERLKGNDESSGNLPSD